MLSKGCVTIFTLRLINPSTNCAKLRSRLCNLPQSGVREIAQVVKLGY
ncbi:MAG: hypothetical protein ABUL77_03110 [Bacteroidota bacterium]